MNPFEVIISPKIYQSLMRGVMYDPNWAAYFLLINTCCEILKNVPDTKEACEQADSEELLVKTLEQLGKVIAQVLPGGAEEFEQYMPRKQ